MDPFLDPRSANQIIELGDASGGIRYWEDVLHEDSIPHNLWRGLLYVGCKGHIGNYDDVRKLLSNPSSRVRGWACYAIGQAKDVKSTRHLEALQKDSSLRVRHRAAHAIRTLAGKGHQASLPVDQIPPENCLILISDDCEEIRDALAQYLQKAGYRVATSSSEDETIQQAAKLVPTMIITDNQKGKDNSSGLTMTLKLAMIDALDETLILMQSADAVEPIFLWNGGDTFAPKGLMGTSGFLLFNIHAFLRK